MRTVLTIAGFDPSSGAGITADLAVFAMHRLFGISAITALTVQSTVGVESVHPVTSDVLGRTLATLHHDLPPVAIKIGMLATEDNVEVVASYLAELRATGAGMTVVLDPVIRSTSGRELLSPLGVERMLNVLLPLVDWVTPNLSELGELTGRPVSTRDEMEAAAAALANRYDGLQVVATGGHLTQADDLVVIRGASHWLRGERIASRSTHGTGCAFSSALLAGLTNGLHGVEACASAKAFVRQAILHAQPLGSGDGPMNLYWSHLDSTVP